jgi:hypothetical protein
VEIMPDAVDGDAFVHRFADGGEAANGKSARMPQARKKSDAIRANAPEHAESATRAASSCGSAAGVESIVK